MSDAPMKGYKPNEAHQHFQTEIVEAMRRANEAHPLSAQEKLAIVANLTGWLLADLDQRLFTPEMGLRIVERNLMAGNQDAIHALVGDPKGSA